jgi:16S rRNA (guanine527-N7)-methyltransferase
MENFIDTYNVSRETTNKLKLYHESLEEWQIRMNLVANSTIKDAWNRHFIDSSQLFQYIPKTAKTLVDIGSGAGFPGMVLAIIANDKIPYLKITLVESVHKKTVYLNHVKEITSSQVNILNKRIENVKEKTFDVITARAVIALKDLLKYAQPLFRKNTVCIFPKGKNYIKELEEAKKDWLFTYEVMSSVTSEESVVLLIRHLVKKKGRK